MLKQTMSTLPLLAGAALLLPASAVGQVSAPSPAARPVAAGMTLGDFTARRERRTLSADTDGDGTVSRAEFLASARSARGDPARRFDTLDRNADGMLDRQEIDAVASRRFRRMDADGDGIVTATERSSLMAAAKRNDPGD